MLACDGYHIYRDGIVVGGRMRRRTTPIPVWRPTTIYYYAISAFDAASNESARSAVSHSDDDPENDRSDQKRKF